MTATTESVTEAGVTPGSFMHRMMVREAIDSSNLPPAARDKLSTQLLESDITDEATIKARVTEAAGIWEDAMGASGQPLPGQSGRVEVGTEEREKLQHALDGMRAGRTIEGVSPFRSIKEAYSAFTGKHPYGMGDADFNRALLAESIGAVSDASARLTESLTTGSWAEALGDSITRQLIAEYQRPDLQTWRQIVSEIGPINDFRTNRRVRVGGYDVLPVVAEGAAYTALTSPTDEEATYAISKKGGTEDYTLEMVANDDLRALRRIPQNLGQAAALTLYRAIWNDTIAANAVIYDAAALFDATHGNTTATTPLDEAGIETLRTKMVRQTRLGETSGFLAATPRFLVTPPELYTTAFKLTQSGTSVVGAAESATTPNPFLDMRLDVLFDALDGQQSGKFAGAAGGSDVHRHERLVPGRRPDPDPDDRSRLLPEPAGPRAARAGSARRRLGVHERRDHLEDPPHLGPHGPRLPRLPAGHAGLIKAS